MAGGWWWRNGHARERTIVSGVGPAGRSRRRGSTIAESMSRAGAFVSLPRSCRRICGARRVWKELIPRLYLKGISTGDFSEALEALLGPDAPGLSATTGGASQRLSSPGSTRCSTAPVTTSSTRLISSSTSPACRCPGGVDLFRKLASAGHDLLALHLLESPTLLHGSSRRMSNHGVFQHWG